MTMALYLITVTVVVTATLHASNKLTKFIIPSHVAFADAITVAFFSALLHIIINAIVVIATVAVLNFVKVLLAVVLVHYFIKHINNYKPETIFLWRGFNDKLLASGSLGHLSCIGMLVNNFLLDRTASSSAMYFSVSL